MIENLLLHAISKGEIGIQAIGFLAMALGISSYQCKTRKGILLMQLSASVLWIVQFLFLKSYAGAMLNGVAIVRNLLFSFKGKYKWADSLMLPAFVMVLFAAAGLYTYTLEGLISIIPTVAMLLSTVALYITNEKVIRILSLFVSPPWLIYDAISGSDAGVLCESFMIISIIVAMIRYRDKKINYNKG